MTGDGDKAVDQGGWPLIFRHEFDYVGSEFLWAMPEEIVNNRANASAGSVAKATDWLTRSCPNEVFGALKVSSNSAGI